MTREWTLYGLLLVLLLLLFGLAQMPVRQLLAWFPPAPGIALAYPKGNLANGSIDSLRFDSHSIGPVHWQWSMAELLIGRFAFDLQLQQADLQASGRLTTNPGGDRLTLSGIDLDASAAGIEPSLGGRLYGHIASLYWSADGFQAKGRLVWSGASSRLLGDISGGDIVLSANGNQRLELATAADSGADLLLSGEISLSPNRLSYRLQVSPSTPAGREAMPLLHTMGKLQADGSVLLSGTRQLRL